MANNMDTSVYVDTEALQSWSSQLQSINSKSIDILDSFKTAVNDMNQVWEGNSAEGFYATVEELLGMSIEKHKEMQHVDRFLLNVVDVMNKQ